MEKSSQTISNGEIFIKDIRCFFFKNRQLFFITVSLGILSAFFFILNSKPQYEANLQIELVQTTESKYLKNIENSELILKKISYELSSPKKISECLVDENNLKIDDIKVSRFKGLDRILLLSVRARTPELANECASRLFNYIKFIQIEVIKPYHDAAKKRILQYQKFLNKYPQSIPNDSYQFDGLRGFELLSLINTVNGLEDFLSNIELFVSQASRPVYVSEVPLSPSKIKCYGIGLFSGFLVGFMLALMRRN